MRRRFSIALAVVVLGVGAFALLGNATGQGTEERLNAEQQRSAASEANRALVDSLPVLPKVRFHSFSEIDGPPGGSGLQWWVTYTTDTPADAAAAAEAYAAQLFDWRVIRGDSPNAAGRFVARRGTQWVFVEAARLGERGQQPALVVSLNALDGELYGRTT